MHSRIHIRADRILSCPKCPFVTQFKHHLEYHLRNHAGSKPFRCTRCDYACVSRSMLNSHSKSHTNVYRYRCADCVYASKYCQSLKLHLRKHGHRPAAVLSLGGSRPTDRWAHFDGLVRRGCPRGPRTASPTPVWHRKLSSDDGGRRSWSAEAEIRRTSMSTSEKITSRALSADSWPVSPLKQPPVASLKSVAVVDPYAFIAEDCRACVRPVDDIGRRSMTVNSDDHVDDNGRTSTGDDERSLPVRKRRRNAEFVARLTADIEAELSVEDRPLDLTLTRTVMDSRRATPTRISTMEEDGCVTGSPTSSTTSETSSQGARRLKSAAGRCVETSNATASNNCTPAPRTTEEDPRLGSPPSDRRRFVECQHCRIGFRDRVTYALHMGYHGFDSAFLCNMCGYQAADRVEFFVHIANAAH